MDWLSEFEHEDKSRKEKGHETAERFRMFEDHIRPRLDSAVSEVNRRLEAGLRAHYLVSRVVVDAPKNPNLYVPYMGSRPYHFDFWQLTADGLRVRVSAGAERYELIEGMTFGEAEVVVDGQLCDVDELLSTRLDLLLRWLVTTSRTNKSPGSPFVDLQT